MVRSPSDHNKALRMKTNEITNYRTTLLSELDRRRSRNPRYSIRAFARDLNVTYSRLNEALNAQRGISEDLAVKISTRLGHSKEEQELFVTQVMAEHGRSASVKKLARAKLKKLTTSKSTFALLALEQFHLIANWCHYAILELMETHDFRSDQNWIAKRLGLSRPEVSAAMERLLRIGLLEKVGAQYRPADSCSTVGMEIPSEGIRLHQEQLLQKANSALHEHSLDERDFSTLMFAFNSSDLSLVKHLIKDFRHNLSSRLRSSQPKDSVYALGVQFFRIDQKPSSSKEKPCVTNH